jgi:hypothetical protein
MRHDPVSEPRDLARATPLRARRQCIPAIHEPATPELIADEDREFIAEEIDAPTIVRRARTLTEAARAYADAQVYPAAPILAAADRERRLAALIADAQRDGATTPDAIAAHLTRMGVAVRV